MTSLIPWKRKPRVVNNVTINVVPKPGLDPIKLVAAIEEAYAKAKAAGYPRRGNGPA